MRQMWWIFVVSVLIVLLSAACEPATSQNGSQDGAYPGPVESDGAEAPAAGEDQAYPEPNPAAPVDVMPFEIVTQNEYSPVAGDASLDQGTVFINESGIVQLESNPVQVKLALSGSLPTPCNALRVEVLPPDANNEIHITVYSVSDPEMMCVQVLSPFDVTIPIGNFTSGSYRVMVNDEAVGTIDLP
jgi:hypothetical protein